MSARSSSRSLSARSVDRERMSVLTQGTIARAVPASSTNPPMMMRRGDAPHPGTVLVNTKIA